jgi:hypothetical protein
MFLTRHFLFSGKKKKKIMKFFGKGVGERMNVVFISQFSSTNKRNLQKFYSLSFTLFLTCVDGPCFLSGNKLLFIWKRIAREETRKE